MSEFVNRQVALVRMGDAGVHTAIFMHIGKTAGTTMTKVLDRYYPKRAIFDVSSHSRATPIEQLSTLTAAQLGRLRLVRGHFAYGVHEVLPGPALYITLLRDPYARIVSAYRHIVRTPTHRVHREVVDRKLTLSEFVMSGVTLETDNWQARCIAGDEATPFGCCDETMLERANRNLSRDFALVGLSERFDESLVVLSRMYGWSRARYVSANRARGPSLGELPDAELAAIEPFIALDRQLYARCADMLAVVAAQSGGVESDVAALRRRNALHAPIDRSRSRIRDIAIGLLPNGRGTGL